MVTNEDAAEKSYLRCVCLLVLDWVWPCACNRHHWFFLSRLDDLHDRGRHPGVRGPLYSASLPHGDRSGVPLALFYPCVVTLATCLLWLIFFR